MSLYLVDIKTRSFRKRKVAGVFHLEKEWFYYCQGLDSSIFIQPSKEIEDYRKIIQYSEQNQIREFEILVDLSRYQTFDGSFKFEFEKLLELVHFFYAYTVENDVTIGLLILGYGDLLFDDRLIDLDIRTSYAYTPILPGMEGGFSTAVGEQGLRLSIPTPIIKSTKKKSPRSFDIQIPLGTIKLDESFHDKLMKLLIESGKTNTEVYGKAGISKQVFSKIVSSPNMIPTKGTIFCLALGLELNLNTTVSLLAAAGYSISKSLISDMIVAKYISLGIYDMDRINSDLNEYDCQLLGWRPRE